MRGGDSSQGFEASWYLAAAREQPDYPCIDGSINCDVCIVGAGYTGLSAAIELSRRGFRVVVVERYRIGAGASGRNGGVLGMGQRLDQRELESWLGESAARALWTIASDANDLVRSLVNEFGINCDLTDGHLTVAHRPRYETDLWRSVEHLHRNYGYVDVVPVERAQVADMLGVDTYFGGILDRRAGHLQPLDLVRGYARAATQCGARVFEHSAVTGVDKSADGSVVIRTVRGDVRARHAILACNGYLGGLEPSLAGYQMPINNFMLATAPLGEAAARQINRDSVAVVDTRFVVNYFHNSPDHRLIFGGGENYSSRFPRDIAQVVRKRMLAVYPHLQDVEIEYAWGGTLAITLRRMPHFGRRDDVIWWAQGYSGHGIAMATMGGRLVAEAIAGSAEGFDVMARVPQWRFPGGRALRWPALVAGMLYYAALDRL